MPLIPTDTVNAAYQRSVFYVTDATVVSLQIVLPTRTTPYNCLMKGLDSTEWVEASAQEFDHLLSSTMFMHFIRLEDRPPDILQSVMLHQT